MKQFKHFFATTVVAACFLITNSCSQTTVPGSSSVLGVFEATTPCDDLSKTLLKIPTETKSEMMKWNLTLYQDPKTFAPSTYNYNKKKPKTFAPSTYNYNKKKNTDTVFV